MRARVLQATIAAVAVAVLLLGIPLAIFGARYIYGQEVQRVETRAQDLLASAVNSYERNRSAAEAGFVDQSVVDRAVQPQDNDIVAYVTVNQPNGEQLVSGDPVAGATIDRGLTSEEQPVMGVVVSVSAWPAYIKAINVVVLVVFGSVGAFAAGAVTAAWQANRLAQPFVYLAASAEQLGAGQVRPRLDPSGVEEIDLVAAELARSSDRLAARLAVERQFTSDASHQLRTPLTALTMRLEEITLTSSEPEVQEEARISLEQVERLVGVVDDLLTRSRRAQGGTTESVDVTVVFLQQEEEWRESFERAGRHLNVEDSGGARVLATPGALAQVLSTLLENSLKHGGGSAVAMYEHEFPGVTYTIATHFGFQKDNEKLEQRLARWPVPSVVPFAGTWLGQLDASYFESRPGQPPAAKGYPGADAYLYTGPRALILRQQIAASTVLDTKYITELRRRAAAVQDPPGGLMHPETFFQRELESGALEFES